MAFVDTPRELGDTDAPHVSSVTPEEDFRTILLNAEAVIPSNPSRARKYPLDKHFMPNVT